MYDIISLKEDHLRDASRLVSERYLQLYKNVPVLPRKYIESKTFLPLLQNLFRASGAGVAAFHHNRLVGFLTGRLMPSFRGKRSVYSPEWANAAELIDSAKIYQEMYSILSAEWVSKRYIAHYISLFPNDTQAYNALYWMGFGMISVDAIRSLDPIEMAPGDYPIRAAVLQDVDQVRKLHEDLRSYMRKAPIFLITAAQDRVFFEEWLSDTQKVVWLASAEDKPAAFMRLGPADEDVCTIIQDEGTTSIYAAFTAEKVRNGGLGASLLNHALCKARKSGYERCAVCFEPMNLLGTNFWLKYFQPVCYSVVRYIDQRVLGDCDSSI